MSWADQVRSAYAYNQWANEKVLDAAAKVSDEELSRGRTGSYGAIASDLTHIVAAQRSWTAILSGEERPSRLTPPTSEIIATLRPLFDASHERLREMVAVLDDAGLARVITVKDDDGQEYSFPAWQVLFHVANHGTQHRAEIGIVLLGLGASPGDLDAVDFFVPPPG